MLVLTRKQGERIFIDGGIVLTVLAVKGQQIRLGFEAPAAVGIQREELLAGWNGVPVGSRGAQPRTAGGRRMVRRPRPEGSARCASRG